MATQTRPVKNQIAFHEKINKIENASGNIYLNLEISTTHLIIPTGNIRLYIDAIDPQILIPENSLIQVFAIIHPISSGLTLSFDPQIIWHYIPNLNINMVTNNDLAFHFFSYDSGLSWKGVFAGSFGI